MKEPLGTGVGVVHFGSPFGGFEIRQKVVRTHRCDSTVWKEETHHFRKLTELLEAGWVVVMCNRIGDDLEYIVQKTEITEREDE